MLPQVALNKTVEVLGVKPEDAEMELKVEDEAPVYEISSSKIVNILGIIPVEMPITNKVDAQSSDIKDIQRPWWTIFVIS